MTVALLALLAVLGGARFIRRGTSGPPTSADELAGIVMSFDRNGDGVLTRDELPERFQDMFNRADLDTSASVTLDELRALAAAQLAHLNDPSRRGRRGDR